MYDVTGLRDDVGHAISQELSDDTVVETFCSAHTYNVERLKTTVTNFLKRCGIVLSCQPIISRKPSNQNILNEKLIVAGIPLPLFPTRQKLGNWQL